MSSNKETKAKVGNSGIGKFVDRYECCQKSNGLHGITTKAETSQRVQLFDLINFTFHCVSIDSKFNKTIS